MTLTQGLKRFYGEMEAEVGIITKASSFIYPAGGDGCHLELHPVLLTGTSPRGFFMWLLGFLRGW